jgi:hypothetical protein
MKIVLRILLFIVIGLIGTGLYLQTTKAENAELLIGSGVLVLAFLLIPLFVYNGYKGKDLTRYSFKNMQGPEEK